MQNTTRKCAQRSPLEPIVVKPSWIRLAILRRHAAQCQEFSNIAWLIPGLLQKFNGCPNASIRHTIGAEGVHPIDNDVFHREIDTMQADIPQDAWWTIIDAGCGFSFRKGSLGQGAFLGRQSLAEPMDTVARSAPKLRRVEAVQAYRPICMVASRKLPQVRASQATHIGI